MNVSKAMEAVSYTHLDVYKRQITECAQCKEVGSIPAPSTYLDVHKSAGAVHPLSVADP